MAPRRIYRISGTLSIPVGAAILMGWLFLGEDAGADRFRPNSSANSYQTVTGEQSDDARNRWDSLFNSVQYVYGKEPTPFLKNQAYQLPLGRALDIAMGEGQNAVFLARRGFDVDGIDFSEVALRKARRLARESGVKINTINADLNKYSIRANHYDVIVNVEYLQRSLVNEIKKGLKKGGVVVFENQTVDQLSNPSGRSISREDLLEKGELREMFKSFDILYYSETNDGKNAMASLVARKK